MKLSELNLNDEYAIVPNWTYSSKEARDVNKVKEILNNLNTNLEIV